MPNCPSFVLVMERCCEQRGSTPNADLLNTARTRPDSQCSLHLYSTPALTPFPNRDGRTAALPLKHFLARCAPCAAQLHASSRFASGSRAQMGRRAEPDPAGRGRNTGAEGSGTQAPVPVNAGCDTICPAPAPAACVSTDDGTQSLAHHMIHHPCPVINGVQHSSLLLDDNMIWRMEKKEKRE
jgi:hypothetical protein